MHMLRHIKTPNESETSCAKIYKQRGYDPDLLLLLNATSQDKMNQSIPESNPPQAVVPLALAQTGFVSTLRSEIERLKGIAHKTDFSEQQIIEKVMRKSKETEEEIVWKLRKRGRPSRTENRLMMEKVSYLSPRLREKNENAIALSLRR
eukprot:CAMPEP_0184490274 /NCGR_PEP_ID=MMETSP0113_2-20130426/17454_1 /TAXON_ID=91329 /ORGANISM="Norrisiella sphaerica, Strain BC52" /LENGTH=148 /DNA_ID=CAMNT_0026874071 /DNA_START=226 /DNA_END=672 /DNA_ORIENTATION=-